LRLRRTLRPVSAGAAADAAFLATAAALRPAAAVAMPVTLPMMPPRLTGAGAFFFVTTVVPLASDVLLPPLAARPRADRAAWAAGGAGVRRPRTEGAAAALGRVGRGFSVLAPAEADAAAAGFVGEGARATPGLAAGAALKGDCGRVRELAFLGERTWPASILREMALPAAVVADAGAAATRVRLRGTESSCVWFSLSEPRASGPIMSALRWS
jgi:hypothetical protein